MAEKNHLQSHAADLLRFTPVASPNKVKWLATTSLQCKAIVPGTEDWSIQDRLCCGNLVASPRVSYCAPHLKAFTQIEPIDLTSELADLDE